jgi:thiamine-phosphate pyrophosphorylase
MSPRHPHALPRIWLMTDERMGEGLWPALQRLPKGSGVIFRHYATPPPERRSFYDKVRSVAKRRRLMLLLAGSPRVAVGWRADGAHGRSPHRRTSRRLIRTAPAHSARELHAARHADLALVSPVFPTRSHPGSKALGPAGLGVLMRRAGVPVIALGGMTARRARSLATLGITGWAAIDAWSRE